MFAKRKRSLPLQENRKEKWMRFFCIAQLCLAFSLICWQAGYPYMGRVFDFRWELGLYEYVIANERFGDLQEDKKSLILNKLKLLKQEENKGGEGLKRFFTVVPLLETFWMGLAVILPFMALKRRDGIKNAIWLLPLVAGAYIVENVNWGRERAPLADSVLFPREGDLGNFSTWDKEGLEGAWTDYLARVWGEGDKELGAFNFTVARLEKRPVAVKESGNIRESNLLLMFYVVWNGLVAWSVWRVARE